MEHEVSVGEGISWDSPVLRVAWGDIGSNGGRDEPSGSRDRLSTTQTIRVVCHACR